MKRLREKVIDGERVEFSRHFRIGAWSFWNGEPDFGPSRPRRRAHLARERWEAGRRSARDGKVGARAVEGDVILFEVTFRQLGRAHSGIAIVWAKDEADALVQVRKLARKHDRDFAVEPKASSIAQERGIVYEHSGGCC